MRCAIAYYGMGIRSGLGKAVCIINSASRTQTASEATSLWGMGRPSCRLALAATCEKFPFTNPAPNQHAYDVQPYLSVRRVHIIESKVICNGLGGLSADCPNTIA